MAKRVRKGLPTREAILDFIASSPTPVGKREIARQFKVHPADRVALKGLIKEIEREGAVERGPKRRLAAIEVLPAIAELEISDIDLDGEVAARPLAWPEERGAPPKIFVVENRLGADEIGQRVVARITRLEDGSYEARVVRLIAEGPARVLGVFRRDAGTGGRIEPTDRRAKLEYRVAAGDRNDGQSGELVLAEILPTRRLAAPQARIVERLGDTAEPRTISLIAIHSNDIPTEFPHAALAQAEAAKPVKLGKRTDLRDVPLVTIDGSDARDFDDAVWAAPDPDPANKGGWHIMVAIADVSWYVRPGDALDNEAEKRGNSVYFPDRVVPMLPEALSNELCSLKPDVPRACLAVHMWLDAGGRKTRHRFVRGLMRSAARLTYEQVQAARDGTPDATTRKLLDTVVAPLYGAFAALDKARAERGTLNLDLPERRVLLDESGRVAHIERRQRLDSHRLIEEFMIAANVAAAETLEKQRQFCMYRVHDAPDPAKLEALRKFLEGLEGIGLRLAKGQAVRPRDFNRLLSQAAGTPYAAMINDLVLRSQAQAVYSPENLGHFGLALRRYAHFTSPIRRYADLLVHRALVSGHNEAGEEFGEGGSSKLALPAFAAIATHISQTERRAAAAERSAIDRYTAAYLSARVGASFAGRINGVTRFGLFITLEESGADGLVPIGSLPGDYYHHEEAQHRLIGRRSGRIYRLGDPVTVRLAEANPVTGGLILKIVENEEDGATRPGRGAGLRPSRGRGGKPAAGKSARGKPEGRRRGRR
ncbi:MAG TPA: ribonuclease R [Stellaceae bacterium]|nr:ribonuclease R [Stellaceae bacterium]